MSLGDVWLKVSEGLGRIYQIQSMSAQEYMALYT